MSGVATQTVYVQLLNEGTRVHRPTLAQCDGGNVFTLLPFAIPDDEAWEFAPDTRVRCEIRLLQEHAVLVAVARADEL